MRNLLDGLFYLVFTGCQWRHLPPPPAPPWSTVYGYMRTFLWDGVWESIRHQFVVMLREGTGRDASPTAAIIDTQSVKTTESGGPCGCDAARQLNGRKRHVAGDMDGLLLGVVVHAANIQDADGARKEHRFQRIIFGIQSDSSGKSVIRASVASRGG
jgi:putative transposase